MINGAIRVPLPILSIAYVAPTIISSTQSGQLAE